MKINLILSKIFFKQAFFNKAFFSDKFTKIFCHLFTKIKMFLIARKSHKLINVNIGKILKKIIFFILFHNHFIFELMKELIFYWNFKEFSDLFSSIKVLLKRIDFNNFKIIRFLLKFFIFFVKNVLNTLL